MKVRRAVHLIWWVDFFIPQQILFLNKWFPRVDQRFFVYGAPERYFEKMPTNVFPLKQSAMQDFINEARAADRVILNGLPDSQIPVHFARFPEIVKKSIWLPWGGDLYWQVFTQNSLQKEIETAFRRQFFGWLYGIATPIRSDYELTKAWYKTEARYIESAPNIFRFEQIDLDRILTSRSTKDDLQIQLGNSGNPSNEHFEMFEWFRRLKNRPFKLYAPLSYGDRIYIEKVIRRGRELFGARFVPLTTMLGFEEYNRHLASMDVLILNHRRPQGFGNTAISLYLGVKVFLRGDVTTWPYLTEKLGCRVYDTRTIAGLSLDALVDMPDSSREQNRQNIAILFDRNWQKAMWQRLYDA